MTVPALVLNRYLPLLVLVDTWPACGRTPPCELVASLPGLQVLACIDPLHHATPHVWEIEMRTPCPDDRNHHLYSRCGTCCVRFQGLTLQFGDVVIEVGELVEVERSVHAVDPDSTLGQAMASARESRGEAGPADAAAFDEGSVRGEPVTD